MQEIKTSLYQLCLNFIKERIETAEFALKQAREASSNDTKSSAGDKYETSREMMQQDIDRNKRLLIDAEENQRILQSLLKVPTFSNTARNGSLVLTNQGNFYLSISAGQLHLNSENYFAISTVSPIGKLLLGKSKSETFDFNGKKYIIKDVV